MLKRLLFIWLLLKVITIGYFLLTVDIPSIPPDVTVASGYEFVR